MVTRLHVKPHQHDSSRREADPATSETFPLCWAPRLPHSHGTAVPPLPRLPVRCVTSAEGRPSRGARIYSRMNEPGWRQTKNVAVLLNRTLFCSPFLKNKDRKNDFWTRSIEKGHKAICDMVNWSGFEIFW